MSSYIFSYVHHLHASHHFSFLIVRRQMLVQSVLLVRNIQATHHSLNPQIPNTIPETSSEEPWHSHSLKHWPEMGRPDAWPQTAN